ncbi:MAG: hypothetical protein LAT57_13650 [Balneolales bacterium]|nr:hypothetical protein [Balneolales bacterium]
MKTLLVLILLVFATSQAYSQLLPIVNHGDRDQAWSLPATPDGQAGFNEYPNNDLNFMIQSAVRFTHPEERPIQNVNLFLDRISSGDKDSTLNYAGPEAMFAWPIPFDHVPQNFLKQATRFTAPETSTLSSVELFAGANTTSSDGFNDTVKISFYEPFQPDVDVIKNGVENPDNNPAWEFNFPVGTARSAYGTRFTIPGGSRLNTAEFWVQNINHSQVLPAGDPVPDDILVAKIWSVNEAGLPGDVLGESRMSIGNLDIKKWNEISFFDANFITEVETDVFITFELEVVGLQDHVAFSSAEQVLPPAGRSIVREDGEWISIAESNAFSEGGARGAELWLRATYMSAAETVNDPLTPDESRPIGDPVMLLMSEISTNDWNEITLDTPISVNRNQDIWMVVELITEGSPDTFSFISHAAEETPRFRSAAYVSDAAGGERWLYLQNTQFNNEYIMRKRATFRVQDDNEITDDLFIVMYSDDANGLPGNFLHLKEVPLSTLTPGEFNTIDVSSWGNIPTVFHIAVSSGYDNNEFALAVDAGSDTKGEGYTSVYLSQTDQWTAGGDLEEFNYLNLLLNVDVLAPNSIETDSPISYRLDGNYPNPFNPTTPRENLAPARDGRLSPFRDWGRSP